MAKTIIIYLSPEIIEDFTATFDNDQAKRSYLYQKVTETINRSTGDVFETKKLQLNLIENGQRTQKPSTLEEIGYDKVEMPENPEWRTDAIAGKLVPFEYMVGDSLWNKIFKYIKLIYISNKIFNDSLLKDSEQALADKKPELNDKEYKQLKESIDQRKKESEKLKTNECLEMYLYALISRPILDKIKKAEQDLLDKEEKELANPPIAKPKRK